MSATTENVQATNPAAQEVQQPAAEVPATATATETPAQPSLRVYFGKVARGTTEADLTAFIKSAGETESISIHERTLPGRRAYFAFANYTSLDSSKKAVELDGQELNGRPVIVQYAKGEEEANADRQARTEKRNAARKAAAEKKAEEAKAAKEANPDGAAAEAGGEAEKPKKKKNARKNRRRAPGDEDEGEEGEDASKARIDGEEATEAAPKKATKPKAKKAPQEKKLEISDEDSPSTIFVANLPFSVDDAALTAIFTNLSIQVKRASVVTRSVRRGNTRKSVSKGFSFVELEDPKQQEEAVQKVNGTLVEGRNITAKIAKLMKEKEVVAEAAAAETEGKGEEAVAKEEEPAKLTVENIEKVNSDG
ncbi:RNA binding protein [Cryptococcus wingfieldii CBS 7118]|uniref:RNA binding protein n=1 Tax=Cryptococcus wingfieldii CBS 7118 TaxID=1295528 RepID=A0A1E3JBS0_9TREE|nr:RNA binding protein [Cryptococcus wingfieldii CBS 7118]ODN98299.1 RNA binding protein [Cryptococcus wingfieldii CBS 7118]